MSFKNLPIEFDVDGKARLKAGVADPPHRPAREPPVAVQSVEQDHTPFKIPRDERVSVGFPACRPAGAQRRRKGHQGTGGSL